MSTRTFDLNIEEVLENWEVHHAIREIIANAIDEQALTRSREIEISKDSSGIWHVRDFGRGLKIEDFTLNENKEKLSAPSELCVIGKFGAGLKDALATFDRRKIGVVIRSSHGTYQIKRVHKHGFDGIVTLHVEYDDAGNQINGTEFILTGINDQDMEKAKSLFLKFCGEQILESNHYGQIISRKSHTAFVYILGVLASEEPNFLFSYNITNLTDTMRKKLNRERLNVGRTTYADRVRSTLKNATSQAVKDMLIEEVANKGSRQQPDELAWIEISQMALTLMAQAREVVYFTEEEILSKPEVLDNAQRDGHEIVTVTEHQKAKLQDQAASGGPQVRTMDAYIEEYKASFSYHFVEPYQLSQSEKGVFDLTSNILGLIGLNRNQVPPIKISETIQLTASDTEGCWDPAINSIVIRRTKLNSIEEYAATLLHETAHAYTHTVDATRDFENVLTGYLGKIANKAVIEPQSDGRESQGVPSNLEIEEPFSESQVNENLYRSVTELKISARTRNCLEEADIKYIGELVKKTEQEMLNKGNLGLESLNEIKKSLSDMGLTLGMVVLSFPSKEELDNSKNESEKRVKGSIWDRVKGSIWR